MPIDARLDAWAILAQKALPARALVLLLRAFDGPEAVLAATRAQLAAVVPATAVDRVLAPVPDERLAATRDWLAAPSHELIAWDDPDYPRSLLDVGDAPPVLFFVGHRNVLQRPALAIVGSRNATPQGLENARAFASRMMRPATSWAGACGT